MLYFTGDIHGNPIRLSSKSFKEGRTLTKNDYVVICGDFGLVWDYRGESKQESIFLDWLDSKPFTTLFVDGNHENFDRLDSYRVERWNGGDVHMIRPSVIHLMRGQIYSIDGVKLFSFGGARSHDISDGILDKADSNWKVKAKNMESLGKNLYRVRGLSWWDNEMPSALQMREATDRLRRRGNNVDIIVSHCASTSIQNKMQGNYIPDELTDFFDYLRNNIDYKQWLCGHYHINAIVTSKDTVLYNSIVRYDKVKGELVPCI